MDLKILWMYHDLMDLYGDKGNIETLRYRASKRGINVVIDTCTLQEERNIEDYDIFFLGGGADKEQTLIYKDLLARKESILKGKAKWYRILVNLWWISIIWPILFGPGWSKD